MAGQGNRRRSVAGRATCDDAGTRALLGDRLQLEEGGSEAERLATICNDDRRTGHSLHPRSFET